MDFRQSYKEEMDSIKHHKLIDHKILDAMEMPEREKSSFVRWKAVVVALACVAIISMNFDSVVSYADTIIGQFSLILGGKEMKLSEMTPIEVDLEKHIAYEKTEMLNDDVYWCNYENQDLLEENTGIIISESENLEIRNIVVDISTVYKTGHLSLEIFSNVGQYHMNGMFVIDGHNQREYGYGEIYKPYYVYEYEEGKKAYFAKDLDTDSMQRVYFSENGIMYQLFVDNSEEGKEAGMQIVDYMSE